MTATTLATFEMLELPRRVISDAAVTGYRVYTSASEFVMIEAALASEAIAKSGIEKPYKVVRTALEIGTVLESALLKPVDIAAKVENLAEKA